jgi:hypothetical protein
LGNVTLAEVLLHEAGDGHAVFRFEVLVRIRGFGHLLTLTDQVLHFTFESDLNHRYLYNSYYLDILILECTHKPPSRLNNQRPRHENMGYENPDNNTRNKL